MFDFEHNNKVYFESEVLESEIYRRTIKYNLKYCKDAILNLIDLTVKITGMINIKTWSITRK